eukprot:TRINITY_DN18811_c0_g4_i1.p3 TRINITY_DN18811_c0_g4~~TRINITY_DN18811_c0_g4_i1.p3  ORF type:complete len:216 (-),score=19.60 TRINITY_DN18811_c0_g4_i1:168-785(-)
MQVSCCRFPKYCCTAFKNSNNIQLNLSFRYARKQCRVSKFNVMVQQGFGTSETGGRKSKESKKSSGRRKQSVYRGDSWAKTCNVNDFEEGKKTKAVILPTGKQLMMYKVDDDIYCSDAASTAFQYPLADAKIIEGENGPIVEVKLDGTQYELKTGKVVKWCPQDNLVRNFLGKLKSSSQPIDLNVYPVEVDDNGDIYADMLKGSS